MTEGRRLAVVRDYDGLHAAMRARAAELAVSRETIDAVSGLQSGYAAKLLAAVPIKGLGRQSLGPMLGALGLMLVVVEDPEALARVRARLVRRSESQDWMLCAAAHQVVSVKFTRKHMAKIARQGARKRLAKIGKRKRSRLARKAARARWRKPRIVELTGSTADAARAAVCRDSGTLPATGQSGQGPARRRPRSA